MAAAHGRARLPCAVHADHPGGQLADRPRRNGLPASAWAMPGAGRARRHRAVRRAHDRPCLRAPGLVQRRLGAKVALVAIAVGAFLSAWLAPPAIVLASTAAFLLSELAD